MQTNAEIYDLTGLKCPLPVLKLRKRMASVVPGDRILVITTDPMALIDIPHFCSEAGHELVMQESDGDTTRFLIGKGGRAA